MRPTAAKGCSSRPRETLSRTGKGPLTCGGAKGTRTPNPLLAKQVRYQLRHGPQCGVERPSAARVGPHVVGGLGPEVLLSPLVARLLLHGDRADRRDDEDEQFLEHEKVLRLIGAVMVGLTGLEPVASSLSGKRSNRLSYRPVITLDRATGAP